MYCHRNPVCSPPMAEVFHYWDRKRAGRLLPVRFDINPADMALPPHSP